MTFGVKVWTRLPPVTAPVVVIDKAATVAAHQSGHNSGVVHAGVYYPAGSAKARLCALGRERLLRHCVDRGLPVNTGGKVVVATAADEVRAVDEPDRAG